MEPGVVEGVGRERPAPPLGAYGVGAEPGVLLGMKKIGRGVPRPEREVAWGAGLTCEMGSRDDPDLWIRG